MVLAAASEALESTWDSFGTERRSRSPSWLSFRSQYASLSGDIAFQICLGLV